MKPLLSTFCALLLASAVAGQGLRTDLVVEGLLTQARVVESADGEQSWFVPGENELEFAWSDEPLVVNVPFAVDAPAGEPVWIVVSLGFDGFSGEGQGFLHGKDEIRWNAGGPDGPSASIGVARRDGKKWHDGIRLEGDGSDALVLEAGEGWPVATAREADGDARWLRLLRVPEGESLVEKAVRQVIYFPPDAPRGAYALWFTVPAGYIQSRNVLVQPEEITGEFRAVVFSTQEEEPPNFHELMVAAGHREQTRPDEPNLSLWKRLPDVQVPVTCRANGWVLDKTWVKEESGPEKVDRSLSGSQGTVTGSGAHSREGWAFTTEYRLLFPERVLDGSVVDIQVSGNLTVHECWTDPFGPWEVELLRGSSYFEDRMKEVGLPGECILDAAGREKVHTPPLLFDDDKGLRDRGPKTIEECRSSHAEAAPHWTPPNDWGEDEPGGREGVFRVVNGTSPCGEHGALEDQGPWALFHVELSWVGEVVQTYRRRSDVESNHKGAAQPPKVDPPKAVAYKDDGFEEWFPTYCKTVARVHQTLNTADSTAAAIGGAVAGNRKHLQILKDAASVQSEHRSQTAWNRIQKRINLLEHEVKDDLGRLQVTVREADEAIEEVRTMLAEQEGRSAKIRREREQLVRWRKEWDDRKFRKALELCLKGEDFEAHEAQLTERDFSALQPRHQWELATAYLDQKRVARATFVMRSLITVAPHAPEAEKARAALGALEAKILRAVADKMSGEVAEARQKFFGWLESRGIGQDQPVGFFADRFEKYWTILSTGPGAFASWVAGRADAMEGESQSIQEAGTGIWLGLKAMEALAGRGTTLEEMDAGLSVDELRRTLHLERAGRVYTDEDYRALGAQIRAALALPEVRALLAGNERVFEMELAEASFDLESVDISESLADAWEYRFDLFSVKNQAMLLLPMSVGTIGGKLVPLSWRPWGFSEATNALKAAQMLGKEVRTGQEILAAAIGWESALAGLATSKVGLRLHQQLELVHASGGLVWKATWAASPLLADIALGYGIVQVAHEYGGPHVAAAAEAVVYTFMWDPTLMATLMRRARTTEAMVARLAKRYGREVAYYEREMVRTRKHLVEMQEVLREQRLDPRRIKDLKKQGPPRTQTAPPTPTTPPKKKPKTEVPVDPDADTAVDLSVPGSDYHPGQNHLDNQRYAAHEAMVALEAGDTEAARRWAKAASAMGDPVESQFGRLQWVKENLDKAVAWLTKNKIAKAFKVAIDDIVDLAWRRGPGDGTSKDLLADADFLRLQGNFDGAAKQYRAAIATHGIEHGSLEGAEAILKKLHVMEEAIRNGRLLPKHATDIVPWQTYGRPSREMIETASRQTEHIKPLGGSLNDVYPIVLGEQSYALKRMTVANLMAKQNLTAEQAELAIEKMMRSELAASKLADLFGVSVPPTVGRITRDSNGRIAGDLLQPWVAGTDLEKEGIGRLLALKDQYAEHRVFSMLLGDYDRHLGNYMLLDGKLVTVDCGQGQLMRWPDDMGEGMQDLMDGWIVEHWWKHRPNAISKNHKMLEQSLVHQDLEPAFARARKVFAEREDEVRDRLQQAMHQLYPDDAIRANKAATEAFEVMRGRIDKMEDRVKKWNADRNGFPSDASVKGVGWVEPELSPMPRWGPLPGRPAARAA